MDLILETERLILRELKPSDAEAFFAMDNNPNVHKYLWQKPTQTIDETRKIIEFVRNQYSENSIGRFAVILKKTNEFMGWCGIKFVTETENGNTNFYDFGYRLNEDFWGKGYATEASFAWLDYGFNIMKIKKMNAYTHSQNDASNTIMKKIGMNFIEDYYDKDGNPWKWWQLKNPNL